YPLILIFVLEFRFSLTLEFHSTLVRSVSFFHISGLHLTNCSCVTSTPSSFTFLETHVHPICLSFSLLSHLLHGWISFGKGLGLGFFFPLTCWIRLLMKLRVFGRGKHDIEWVRVDRGYD